MGWNRVGGYIQRFLELLYGFIQSLFSEQGITEIEEVSGSRFIFSASIARSPRPFSFLKDVFPRLDVGGRIVRAGFSRVLKMPDRLVQSPFLDEEHFQNCSVPPHNWD